MSMSSPFDIIEHQFSGQHVRFMRACLIDELLPIQISAKQYRPKSNLNPHAGDVTVLFAGSNGFSKEVYEPFFEDLLHAFESAATSFTPVDNDGEVSTSFPPRLRAIWVCDPAQLGTSGILNQSNLANDPSHYDHSLDLLQLINCFREDFPPPLLGIGHSLGTTQLVYLSAFHPRLFAALILVEPIMYRIDLQTALPGYKNAIAGTLLKKDLWPSQRAVEEATKRSSFFKNWDSRALKAHLRHDFHKTPTKLHPEPGAVTLVNTKHAEAALLTRPNHDTPEFRGEIGYGDDRPPNTPLPFSRPESSDCFDLLQRVRPPVLFAGGEKTQFHAMAPEFRKARLAVTGKLWKAKNAWSGSEKSGAVEEMVEGSGHLVPMERPKELAAVAARFAASELGEWNREREEWEAKWHKMSVEERQVVPVNEWLRVLGMKRDRKVKQENTGRSMSEHDGGKAKL